MGNPAARASVDKAAHSGPIQSGSPDVIIGGFPAARKGDSFSCTQHGSGIIVGGSGSVLVNGVSLARQGDKTQCNTGGTPASSKPKPAPPQYWGGSLAKKAGEDGTIHGDKFDLRVLGIYASSEDKTGDGNYDTASAGFALLDLTSGNMKSDDLLKVESRTKVATANATGTYYGYSGDSDITGFNNNASATALQYGGTAAIGKPGTLYGGIAGDVTIGTAEAKAVSEIYKGNDGRYGFNAEAGAETAAIKGEVVGNIDIYGVIIADAKIGGSVGAVGASAGIAGYWDKKDDSLNLRVSGELATVLGLKGDVGMKVVFDGLFDWIFEDEQGSAKSKTVIKEGDGTILSGCITILVGD